MGNVMRKADHDLITAYRGEIGGRNGMHDGCVGLVFEVRKRVPLEALAQLSGANL